MGTEKTRNERMKWLDNLFITFFHSHKNGALDKNKLIAEYMKRFIASEQNARELLRMFERNQIIKIEKNRITQGVIFVK